MLEQTDNPAPAAAHILMIDGDTERVRILGEILAQAGYTTRTAEQGQQALHMLSLQRFDLIVLSIGLWGMNSYQLLSRLKAAGVLNTTPVLMLTAEEGTPGIKQCFELGASDYIAAPFLPEVVTVRVRAALLQQRLRKQTVLEAQEAAHSEHLHKIERDVEIARRIQLGFLPSELPALPGWEIAASFHPAREVAGDFYDAFTLINNRRVAFLIADVCDKGVGSAMFMALSISLIRAYARVNYDLTWTDALADLPGSGQRRSSGRTLLPSIGTNALRNSVFMTNEYITTHHKDMNYFVTLFIGILDPASGALLYINGGHEPPIIMGADGSRKAELATTGPAVGIFPNVGFEIEQAQLDPGDTIFCYTDGVTDARNPQRAFFGEERVQQLLAQPAPSASKLLQRFETNIQAHIGSALQFDDITMLAVRRIPHDEQQPPTDEPSGGLA